MWQNVLRFNDVSGDDISISNNSTTAHRFDSTHTGLVFTSRPLAPNEKLSLKLSDTLDKNKDLISIGFTSRPPNKNHNPENPIKIRSLIKKHSIKHKIMYFYASRAGIIYYGFDGVDKGRVGSVQTPSPPLWGYVQIHSAPSSIELVNCTPPDMEIAQTPMTLHQTRGRNVKIVDNAAKKFDKRLGTSYVFTARPLNFDEYVRVKITDVKRCIPGRISLGLISCNPSLLAQQDLPDSFEALLKRDPSWISVCDRNWAFKRDDVIAFVVSKSGEVTIWRNGTALLDVVRAKRRLWWAVFNIADVEGIEVTSSVPKIKQTPLAISPQTINSNEVLDCVVCCNAATDTALCPCGHLCLCGSCARQVWQGNGQGQCPVCRANIENILKIYKS